MGVRVTSASAGRRWRIAAAVGAILLALPATAALAETAPYAGQNTREIASLSEADVAALLAGEGWGLALPAELNGYPGPAHVLEQADALDLTQDQRRQVQAIFEEMNAAARAAGAEYVEAERHLSLMFRMGHATADRLDALLSESAAALSRLRQVHLAAHLEVTPLLSDAQKATYATLRGYASGGAHAGHGGH